MSNSHSEEFAPLTHQVAGCHSGTPSNILINKSGQILKPYKPRSNNSFSPDVDLKSVSNTSDLIPVTLNELDFYAKVDKSDDDDFVELKKISPKFFGSRKINETDHLLLEDFTHGMKYPCVMDLKIGRERYYPGRSETKAKNDKIKYKCLQEFGFCIAGIKLSDPSTGAVDAHYMPKVTRQFNSEQVAEHIKKFLHFDDTKSLQLRKEILEGTEAIHRWSAKQQSILLRGSSLLVVYDAAALEDQISHALKARVGMIDFAHVFHSISKKDENYLEGMNNLVHLLQTGNLPQ